MTVTMESSTGRRQGRERGRKPSQNRRDALMLGASAALHLLIFGPMIVLARGDELSFDLPSVPDIIQVQLEPPPIVPPRPVPLPRPDQPRPQPADPAQPTQPIEAERPQEPALETPQPRPEVWAVTRNLPQLAPQPAPPAPEALDSPSPSTTVSPLDRPLPAVSPLPATPSETLEATQSRAPPASVTVTPPSVATAPAQSSADSSASAASDLNLRRRDEEEQRALAAAAAAAARAATSGPPGPPVPRIAAPQAGGAASPSGSGGAGISDAWRVAPSSQVGRNARALRMSPTGCRFPERLTESERQVCREQFNADAARGAERPIQGSGNAARDARFRAQGARELYRYEEQRRPLSGGGGNVGPADCPGSNLGIGCAGSLLDPSMQMDSSSNVRTKRDGPRPGGSGPRVPGSAGSGARPGNSPDR